MDCRIEIPAQRCLYCSALGAKLRCNGCNGALKPDGTEVDPAMYCGLECHQLHWPHHSSICMSGRRRRTLYRGAILAQTIHYRIRERLWSTNIERIEIDEHRNIHIYELPGVNFIALPETAGLLERHKQAVLANLTCRTALVYFHCLIKRMFKCKLLCYSSHGETDIEG